MPKVTISLPSELNTTARERETLERAFQTKLQGILRSRPGVSVSNIWGIRRVTTETVVARGGRPPKKAPKKAAKKAPKKAAGKKAAKKK